MAWNQKSIKTQETLYTKCKIYERKRISPDWVPFVFHLRIFVVDNLRVIFVPTLIPYIENVNVSVFIYEIRMLNHITHTTSWDSIEKFIYLFI